MADLKQIKVGSTIYNIEPYTSYLPLTGGTLSRNLTAPNIVVKGTITPSSGLIRPDGGTYPAGVLGANGVAFTSPSTPNDCGWMRVVGTDESDTVLELATGDDGGAGESIHFRGYNTSNGISYDVIVPKKTGTIALTSDIPTSLPASDVYAWAKAPTKPTYTKSEVGLGNVDNTADANKNVNYATTSHLLRTYSAGNSSHGEDYYLKCRYNVDWNDRFKLQIVRSDGSVTHTTSVDYANSAGSVAWGNVTGKPNSYTPSNHSHLTADIRDIWDFAAQKSHKHAITDVADLQNQLNSKQNSDIDIRDINAKTVELALAECKAAANAASYKADVMADHTTANIANIDRTPGKFRVLGYSPVNAGNWNDDNVVLTGRALHWLVTQGVLDDPNNIKSISFGGYHGPYTAGTSNKTIGQLSGGAKGAFYVIWGRETREYGHISVQKKTTFYQDYDCVGFASGDHGYWGKSDLTLTVYVPANSTYYLFGQNVEKVYINYYQLN